MDLLSHLVDRTAARAEAREAFVCADQRLSRGELVQRANRLAHFFVEEGVRRGDRIGIFMPRSPCTG